MSAKNNKIALTFDLEYWYCGRVLKKYMPKDLSQVKQIYPQATKKILNLLINHQARATFFILSAIGQKNPQLIKEIHQQGHEIASHGFNHDFVSEMNQNVFESEIIKSKQIIKEITGYDPTGFRAPNFLIKNDQAWVFEILKKHNFKYDSSDCGFLKKIWGKINTNPYDKFGLKEYPIAVYKFLGFNIPLAGGFYFRIIPYPIFKFLLKRLNKKGQIPFLYFHTIDLIHFKIEYPLPWLRKTFKYWGVKKAYKNFQKLLDDFTTITMNQIDENTSHTTTK